MGDIIATIQGEQDHIIRSPLAGVLLVQGGPGTGKTAVALHRAAYLLFTHRATLERQGVLVVGPNPLFLNYIENVLPSLGESGVTLSTIAGLVTNVERARGRERRGRSAEGRRAHGSVTARALRTRERPLRHDVEIPVGRAIIMLKAKYTEEAVERARRRPGNHNQRRSAVGRELAPRLASEYHDRFLHDGADEINAVGELADAIRLTPVQGSAATGLAAPHRVKNCCTTSWCARTHPRGRQGSLERRRDGTALPTTRRVARRHAWTKADAALIDEARILLGPRRRPRPAPKIGESDILDGVDLDAYAGNVRAAALREAARLAPAQNLELDEAEFVTYGHIVIDEAQDLSPMELRVLKRRDLTGSMTIVGDMGQATTISSSASWNSLLEVLQPRRAITRVDLTVSYRTPEEVLNFAAPTLRGGRSRPRAAAARAPRRDPYPRSKWRRPRSSRRHWSRSHYRESLAVAPGRLAVIVTGSRVAEIVELLRGRRPGRDRPSRTRISRSERRPGGPGGRRRQRPRVRRHHRRRAGPNRQSRLIGSVLHDASRATNPLRGYDPADQATSHRGLPGTTPDAARRRNAPETPETDWGRNFY